jgi:hypothetical protein
MVNGRTFVLGVISGAGVSVPLALAGRAVASTGPATEKGVSIGDPVTDASQGDLGRRDDLE